MAGRLIGVTGATGAVGGGVARRLADAGVPQRLIVRDAHRAPRLAGASVGLVPGGYAEFDEMRAALDGVGTLFLVPAEEAEDRLEQHINAVEAALSAGVERIVYLSFLGAHQEAVFTLSRDHWATEEHIRSTGVAATFLRMSLYLDFLPAMVSDGAIRGPAGDGRVGAVLRDDVAAVAAAVLRAPEEHEGQTHDLTGREALTLGEAAEALSRAWGREVRYVDETEDEAYASRAHYGAPRWQVEAWVSTYRAIRVGELDRVTETVHRLTGRQPRTLAEWLAAEGAP